MNKLLSIILYNYNTSYNHLLHLTIIDTPYSVAEELMCIYYTEAIGIGPGKNVKAPT